MRIFVVALLACMVTVALANDKYPPGPSYRSCPDTLTIFDVQQTDTLLAPCHPRSFPPATGDTVLGVRGIITGIDAKPSAFAFYIQKSGGGAFNGLQVFTGATNWSGFPYNLALGDLVAVYGTAQESPSSNGTTEIEGPDAIQSTNDITIRKINSGNALTYNIVDTHKLNWVPTSIGNEGEQWEGSLVRLRGPLKVGRTSTQSGLPPLPFNSFLVVRSASPSDSTLIDGNSLTTFVPPAVGTLLDSLQGIVNQNTTSGVNSYRVQLRDIDDLYGPFLTSLTDAYPIADNFTGPQAGSQDGRRALTTSNTTVRLEFARRVDVTTAQNKNNYSLASAVDGSTVNLATVEGGGGRAVLLDITSVRTDGDFETVSASGIGSESCPTCLMSTQNRAFINGVLDVKQVQAADPDSLAGPVCTDRSRYAGVGAGAGTRLTVRGVGVGQFGSLQYLEDADGAQRSGIGIFGPSAGINVDEQYLIAGQIQEFGGETEIVNNVYLKSQGIVGAPAAVPFTHGQVSTLTNSACDASHSMVNGEDYEGMLIHITRLMVAERRTIGQSFLAVSLSGTARQDTILVSNLNGTLNSVTPPDSGSFIDVTGILHFTSGTFRICPRSASDITPTTVDVGSDPLGRSVTFSAYPNPARSTRISFSLPRSDHVELGVYDVLGRRVAVLARGHMPAGAYTRQWDGRYDSGKQVGPGVFFLRLEVGRETYTLRSVKLN